MNQSTGLSSTRFSDDEQRTRLDRGEQRRVAFARDRNSRAERQSGMDGKPCQFDVGYCA